ncbi:MAG: hypothetical protein VST70_02185 [Nitrospirota bacterium]|nr:hypothetical protein [Nitrospirota bacterium]
MKLFGKHSVIWPRFHALKPGNRKGEPEANKRNMLFHWFARPTSDDLWEDLEWVVLGIFFLYFMVVLYLLFISGTPGY